MNLSVFIRARMRDILNEWTRFADKTAPAGGAMSQLALTDHAEGILTDIAIDIETRQSRAEQFDKSQGIESAPGTEESAAAIHGRLRHESNFSLLQLSSEFRALRATVLRLWLPQVQHMSATTIDEMVRFNEAIDQALAESIVTYSARDDRTRDLFIAILGHDLRAPLASVALVGELLTHKTMAPEQVVALGQKARRSASLMGNMVTDLLGYTRLQMGAGMPTVRTTIDITAVCQAAADDARAMYPGCQIEFRHSGDLGGSFDSARVQQLLTNLLINAAQYSASGSAVTMQASGDAEAILVTVHNRGPVIPAASLATIFKPLAQLDPDAEAQQRPTTSLGLGLYIAQTTAAAHDGHITVTSSIDQGTTFSARFPR